jgi:hypothetical protein
MIMNSLSWLLYWADVLPSIAETLRAIAVITGTVCLFGTPILFAENKKEWAGKFFKGLVAAIVVMVLSFTIPSKNTIYLIAASEMGEEALAAPEALKLRGVVNQWLDKQLKQKENTDNAE